MKKQDEFIKKIMELGVKNNYLMTSEETKKKNIEKARKLRDKYCNENNIQELKYKVEKLELFEERYIGYLSFKKVERNSDIKIRLDILNRLKALESSDLEKQVSSLQKMVNTANINLQKLVYDYNEKIENLRLSAQKDSKFKDEYFYRANQMNFTIDELKKVIDVLN